MYNNMKKLTISIMLLACVLPCAAQHLSKKTEGYIVDRVTRIYNSVIQNLNQIDSMSDEELERMYCSSEWNSLLSRVEEKASEYEEPYFDYDYWIDAQDFEDLHLINVKVESFCGDRAVVLVVFSNFGSLSKKYLELCYERDDWFVNDFINSHRGTMRDYLEQK